MKKQYCESEMATPSSTNRIRDNGKHLPVPTLRNGANDASAFRETEDKCALEQRDDKTSANADSLAGLIQLFDDVSRSSASPQSIVERLVRGIRLALNAHSVDYFRRSDDGDYLIVEAVDSRDPDDTLELAQLAHPLTPDSITVYRRFWDHITAARGPALLDFSNPAARAMALPTSVPWHDRFGTRWALCCPMLAGDRAIGFLGVRTDAMTCFTEAEQRVVQSITQQLTLVMTVETLNRRVAETALLREQTFVAERHAAEIARRDQLLSAVVRFSETLARPDSFNHNMPDALVEALAQEREHAAMKRASELTRINSILTESVSRLSHDDDPSRVLDRLVEQVAHVVDAYHVFLFVYDPHSDTLSLQRSWLDGHLHIGMRGNELPLWAAPFPADITPAWRLMCEKRELHTPANVLIPAEEFAWPGALEYLAHIGASDAGHMALLVGDEPVGSMGFALTEGRKLPVDDVALVESIGRQAAVALKMVKQAEQSSAAAVARERQQAVERRTEELVRANASLSRSLMAVSQSSDFDDTIETIFSEIVATTGAVAGQLFLYEPYKNTLTTTCWIDESGRGRGSCPDSPVSIRGSFDADITPAFRQYVNAGEIMVAEHAKMPPENSAITWPGVIDWHLERDRASSCAVPVLIGSRPLGVIGLAWKHAFEFAPEQRELLFALTNQVALVMQLRDLAEAQRAATVAREREAAAERRAEELCRVNDALQSIIDALPSMTNLDEFLPAVLGIVAQSFGANQCALYEHHSDIVNLRYWYMDGCVYNPDEVLNFDPVRYDTIIELAGGFKVPPEYLGTPVTDRARAVLVDHYAGTTRPDFDAFALRIDAGLELNVPLVVDRKAIGAICIYRPKRVPYSPTEVSLAEALARQLAFAMQTATLAVQVRDAAIVGEREVAAHQRAEQLDKANRALRRAVARFAETPKIEAFLGFVLSESAELIEADGGCMTVYDAESDRVRGVGMSFGGQPVDFPGRTEYTLAETPILRRVISEGPVEIDILAEPQLFWPAVRETLAAKGMKWGIAFPLSLEGKVFGHMNLTFRNRRSIEADQRSIVTALTTQGALAVLLSQLAQAAQRSALLEERSRMAREIHDTVAQGLVAILMHSRAAASGDDPLHHLAVVQRLAEENLAEARRSVRALRPTDSGPDGLQGRLLRNSKKMSDATKKTVTFLNRGQCATMPDIVEDELYRIAQEAVANAVKHSGAVEVNLELIAEGSGLMLTVSDSGSGFDTDYVPDGRYGVVGMIERAERIGAALTIVSEPGRGTTVVVRWQPGHSSREWR